MALSNLFGTLVEGKYWEAPHTEMKNPIGAVTRTKDGRTYVYARAGGTIGLGDVTVAAPDAFAVAATYFGAAVGDAPAAGEGGAIGDVKIRHCVVTGTLTMTADEYADGLLVITDGTGEGQAIPLRRTEANGAAGSSFLYLAHPLQVALSNSSVGQIVKNPWADVVAATHKNAGGDPGEIVVGVCQVAGVTTTLKYFWVQTYGLTALQAGATTIMEAVPVIIAEDDDGSGQIVVATENVIQTFGVAMVDIADTIFGAVYLQIRP